MPKPSPFFSIILPTYNREQFLATAITSVINQTIQDWELLIIDDGSTDKTKELVAGFADNRIHYHYQENKERSAARNNGIERSLGKYICFLDSDDYYLQNHLQIFYEEISKRNFPEAFFCTGSIAKKGDEMTKTQMYIGSDQHPVRTVFYHFVLPDSACLHRNILMKHRFNEEQNVFEDTNLWMRILVHYPFIQIPEYTSVLVVHKERSNESFFKDVNMKLLDNYIRNINQVFEVPMIQDIISKAEKKEYILSKYSMAAYAAAWSGKMLKVFRILVKMTVFSPDFLLKKGFYLVIKEALAGKYRQLRRKNR